MKKILSFLISISLISNIYAKTLPGKVTLTSSILKLVDGVPFGLDGTTIGDMLYVRREVRKMQYGIPDPDKKLVGNYMFQGKKYSVHSLARYELRCEDEFTKIKADLEQKYLNKQTFLDSWKKEQEKLEILHAEELTNEYNSLRKKKLDNTHYEVEQSIVKRKLRKKYEAEVEEKQQEIKFKYATNSEAYRREFNKAQEEYQQKITLLHSSLNQAKEDFITVTMPFMEQARGTKHLMYKLIEESCQKRGRSDSLLLEWGEAKEEEEIAMFHKTIKNFKKLDTFCTDLTNFIEDVVHSCPKGLQQYLEERKQKQNK